MSPRGTTIHGIGRGWALNSLKASAGDQANIIVDIDHAIQNTFIPSNGPLEMNSANEWSYQMPWNKFDGARGFSLSPLCDCCLRFFASLNREQGTYAFGGCEWALGPDSQGMSHLRKMEGEMDLRCQYCRLTWDQLSAGDRKKLGGGFVCKIFGSRESGLHHLTYSYVVPGGDLISRIVTMFPKDVEVFPNSFLSGSINSETSWALARLWLQHCTNNHKECRDLHPEVRRLPTRLIDIGQGNQTVQPRLCHSIDLSPDSQYTTLSHRWGINEMLQLTMKEVEAWSNSLPVERLPLTFRHAMEATKQLGIQYLWIDCLCIIQDSDDDWQREAALMGDVYQNSHCNLTAAAPNASSDSGLFAMRDPSQIHMCFADVKNFSYVSPHGPASQRDTRWFCWDGGIWERNVVDSPLFTRGWVVQEHILAPRMLHFTERQMFWECVERRACEALPALIPALNFERKLSVDTISMAPGPLVRPQTDMSYESQKTLVLWETIVERYSATSLTFAALDKLTALSGIAQKVGMAGEYLAGIWEIGLEVHLMWHRKKREILTRPAEYQAPSWSWASVNGSIEAGGGCWPTGESKIVASILGATVERAGLNTTGRVINGEIRLRGALAHITVRNVIVERPDGWWVEDWYESAECPSIRALPDVRFVEEEEESREFYALIVTLNISGKGFYGCNARGLLLQPTGKKKGEYFRRGLFCCQAGEDEMGDFLELFRAPRRALSDDLPKDYYENERLLRGTVHGLPTYEVTLI